MKQTMQPNHQIENTVLRIVFMLRSRKKVSNVEYQLLFLWVSHALELYIVEAAPESPCWTKHCNFRFILS